MGIETHLIPRSLLCGMFKSYVADGNGIFDGVLFHIGADPIARNEKG